MPRLLRLYLASVAVGFALAICFTLLLIALDVGHLRHLVTHTSGGAIAVAMLVAFHTILFSGVQFGYAVMRLARKDAGPRGGKRRMTLNPAPIPARNQAVAAPAAAGATDKPGGRRPFP
ncbi:hypothetical protein PE067_04525 [Paracoccus sp. DMF-8]|uniref:hypothetical protein n=1 Tax=Paracoccus sp. DMF-8 TaxID=3019445 RepID=UPI0023E874EE|nr:hypothetical protein [Paracoccus sp. DMF-8]MDF3605479.1 hypothetical protein [Paracoccus sp. DMF-8]